jgi:peptidoglycan-N-acetylglucosamine deacetylase
MNFEPDPSFNGHQVCRPVSNSIWLDSDETLATKPPIFLDQTEHRHNLAQCVVLMLSGLVTAWIVAFAVGIYTIDDLPEVGVSYAAPPPPVDEANLPKVGLMQLFPSAGPDKSPPALAAPETCPDALGTETQERLRVYAYLPVSAEAATTALRQDCGVINVLMPEWFSSDGQTTDVELLTENAGDATALLDAVQNGAARREVLPVLTLAFADKANGLGVFDDPAQRAEFTANVARLGAAHGICIAPSNLPRLALPGFRRFFTDLDRALDAANAESCIVAPAEGALWRDAEIVAAADTVVYLAFKEPTAEPAPLADQAWFERGLATAAATVASDKLVVALGNFGYDWVEGAPYPVRTPYAEAMRLAALHRGEVDLSPDALNTRVSLTDWQGVGHRIWLLDAVSLYNQRQSLAKMPMRGMALWSVGYEDPDAFTVLGPAVSLDRLEQIHLHGHVGYDGEGPFMRVRNPAAEGRRHLIADPASGLIVAQSYSQIPLPYSIQRTGAGAGKTVALTFDDGPDPVFTDQVLDVLRAEKVPAAFFLIGSNMLHNPDVVARIVADGHEIGNHTFFHPDTEQISDLRQQLELNAEQRLLASITGLRTALYRSPYARGLGPLTASQARPLLTVTNAGYLAVGSDIVPPDWQETSPEALVDFTLAELRPKGSNVIVLHDAGGDRSATVAALPMLIRALRAEGYAFVSLAELLGVKRDIMMPLDNSARVMLDNVSFNLIGSLGLAMKAVFWVAIFAGVARSVIFLMLALSRRHYKVAAKAYDRPVTVVIPAYNEENVILSSIESVLASDHTDVRVIIIDDGSHDHTSERIESCYLNDPRVLILRKQNQGKWRALDVAYDFINTEIVVAIDADTIILPDAISKLVRAFHDPRVGAVAGMVRVGNRDGLLTRLQALEYMTAQHIDRRAAEVFNGIMVVPGAIGAWRVEAVRKAGLYTNETLAEDADLTVSVLRAGYKVVFDEEAVSITEAPSTLRDFLKQRLRWRFGMMQAAWKHRRAAREGHAVGLISIPDLMIFGGVLALLGPLADLVLLGALADAALDFIAGRPVFESQASKAIIAGYLLLPLIDMVTIGVACAFDRRWPTPILLIPFQRFFYRPLLYITVYRATWFALNGHVPGWGKAKRTGTIRLRPDEAAKMAASS